MQGKEMRVIAWVLILVFGLRISASCAEIQASPDKAYKAVSDDSGHTISVFAIPSNRLMTEMGVLGVLKMEWAKNSKVLIVYDHLAGGSEVKVLSLRDGQWIRTDYDPESLLAGGSSQGSHYGVIGVEDEGSTLHIKYLVYQRQRDAAITYSVIEFDVIPPSEKILNIKNRKISEDEGDKIRTIGESQNEAPSGR